MRRRVVLLILAGALWSAVGGCGSKISRANYYRVHHGMTEDEVEDVLGPPHEVATLPADISAEAAANASDGGAAPSTRPVERKQLTWSRDGVVLRVILTDGVVTARSAEGIPAEAPPVPAAAQRHASAA